VYARLGVKTQERGESFYNSRIPATVTALQEVRKRRGGVFLVWQL
jgi:hypothetical protein